MVCKYWTPPRQLKKYLKFHKFFSRWRISMNTDFTNLQEFWYLCQWYLPWVSHTSQYCCLDTVDIFWTISFLLSPSFSFLTSSFSFTPFYSICLVVYQLSKSVRLLFADEVSKLLSDLVTRSARLCVLGTWGTVWRWPLTLIKGSTALFGSYQFNQLAHSCSFTIHDITPIPHCLPFRTYSTAYMLLLHTEFGSYAWALCNKPFICYRTRILRKTFFMLKGRATNRKLSFISETQRSILFPNLLWQFKVPLKL